MNLGHTVTTPGFVAQTPGAALFDTGSMASRVVSHRRSGLLLGACLAASAWSALSLQGQELPLLRDYPGSGPFQCPSPAAPQEPSAGQRAQASQLATDANQAMILGDFERVQALLGRAVQLDPTSADLAYRHAAVLESLDQVEPAMLEFCRALDLNVEDLGILDAQERLDDLAEGLRREVPEAAHQAFQQGLGEVDDNRLEDAVESFTAALDVAPGWAPALHNRGVVYERLGLVEEALRDFRGYVAADPTSPNAVRISERIGLLEATAAGTPRSPAGTLALGMIPGMGQYYIGRPVPGTITLLAAGTAVASGFLFKKVTTLCVEEVPPGGTCPPSQVVDEITERPYMWWGIGIGAAITVVSAIDAARRAKRRRAQTESIGGPGAGEGFSLVPPSVSGSGDQIDFNVISLRFR